MSQRRAKTRAWTGTAEVRRARALIEEGRARGDRTDEHRLVVYMAVAALDAAGAASNARALVEAGAAAVVLQPAEGADIDPVGPSCASPEVYAWNDGPRTGIPAAASASAVRGRRVAVAIFRPFSQY